MNRLIRLCGWLAVFAAVIGGGSMTSRAQQTPDPHQVPVMDGEAGPCSVVSP